MKTASSLLFGCLCTCFVTSILAQTNLGSPVFAFLSRSDLTPPTLNITFNNASAVSPGYIFTAPYSTAQPAPCIYDGQGNLVWSGVGIGGSAEAFNLQAAVYGGTPVLSFYKGNVLGGFGQGLDVILDSTYSTNTTIPGPSKTPTLDLHELMVVDGTSLVATMYQAVPYDLTAYGLAPGEGWIVAGMFLEFDIATGDVLFSWNSLDHVDPSLSVVGVGAPGSTNGTSETFAWDYFHINAVDKTPDGDYLISSRHTSCIYLVSGVDGSIIWRLGGKASSFGLQGFTFSFQHDARWLSETSDTIAISIFDNGSNGFGSSSSTSSGLLVTLNNSTMTASLDVQVVAPGGGLCSTSQGSVQVLPNGNIFVGWGSQPYISEYSPAGALLFYANLGNVQNYRAFKYNWTATPPEPPAAAASSRAGDCATACYASWNGATDVASWQFWSGPTPTGPFTLMATVPWAGFETSYLSPGFVGFVYAVALDANGNAMGNTPTVTTAVGNTGCS